MRPDKPATDATEREEVERELHEAWKNVEAMRLDDPFARHGMLRLGRALVAFHEPLVVTEAAAVTAPPPSPHKELGSSSA